ncbi:MAG TPA: glutathione peroxidase [Asticcacaulis sp.]|nr:glutathione peroxidase [Asticcacaulis sp.]
MTDLYAIPVRRIDGETTTLSPYRGDVLLIVNVASKCGLTPQYEGLEKLYRDKAGQGLEILGFPANNFLAQEPGTDEEIASFCSLTYDVTFPMFAKISVKGDDRHPLYDALTSAKPDAIGDQGLKAKVLNLVGGTKPGDITWNFEKFLIGRDGRVAERFSPDTKPDDAKLVAAIDRELAKPA